MVLSRFSNRLEQTLGTILLMAVVLLAGCQSRPPSKAPSVRRPTGSQREEMIRTKMRSIMLRDVDVEGVVVDQRGKPIRDVRIWERVFRPGETQRTYVSEDGKFKCKYEQKLAVYLHFSKPGYFVVEHRFSPSSRYNQVDGDDGRTAILEKDFRVVLEEVGQPDFLQEIRFELSHKLEGKSKCARLAPIKDHAAKLKKAQDENKVYSFKAIVPQPVEEELHQKKPALPKMSMSVRGQLKGNTEFDTISEKIVQSPERGGDYRYFRGDITKTVSITISGENNGLIPYLTRNHGFADARSWREMKTAPNVGYANTVDWTPRKDMRQAYWVKIGGLYGKCVIRPRIVGNVLETRVILRMQPNGSRNLHERWGASSGTFDPETHKAIEPKKDDSARAIRKVDPLAISFDIKGKITDLDGRPLNNGRLRLDLNGIDVEVSYPKVTDGKFGVVARGKRMFLRATAAGHYPKRIAVHELLKNGIVEKNGRKELAGELKIRLEPTGKITGLRVLRGTLICNVTNNDSYGIQLATKGQYDAKRIKHKYSSASKLPSATFYLAPEIENGKIKQLDEDVKLKYLTLKKGVAPAAVRLRIAGKGNGLIYKKSEQRSIPKSLRTMKTAPLEGYKNEIVLDPASECHTFYVKLGKIYGKGTCREIWKLTSDGTEIRTLIQVALQPDGSGNVRTAE